MFGLIEESVQDSAGARILSKKLKELLLSEQELGES